MPTSYWLKFGNTPVGFNGSGVSFTHVEQPGTLTVSLTGTGTGFDNTKTFDVLVTFGSAISYTVDGVPVSTPSATCTLSLHSGQSSVIGNIPFGTTYAVTEQALSQQDIDAGYATGPVSGGSGTMTDAGTYTVVAGYTYTEPPVAEFTIEWRLTGTGYDPTATRQAIVAFYQANAQGAPRQQCAYSIDGVDYAASDGFTLNLQPGQSYAVRVHMISGAISFDATSTVSDSELLAGYSRGGNWTTYGQYYTQPAHIVVQDSSVVRDQSFRLSSGYNAANALTQGAIRFGFVNNGVSTPEPPSGMAGTWTLVSSSRTLRVYDYTQSDGGWFRLFAKGSVNLLQNAQKVRFYGSGVLTQVTSVQYLFGSPDVFFDYAYSSGEMELMTDARLRVTENCNTAGADSRLPFTLDIVRY